MSQKTREEPVENETVVRDGIEYEEVTHDDQVIGRAFRVSLLVLVALLVVGGGLYWWSHRTVELPAPQKPDVEAPKALQQEVKIPVVRFTDVTREAGITFVRENGAEGDKLLPETMGGGAAFVDYDADGDADLLFVNGAP